MTVVLSSVGGWMVFVFLIDRVSESLARQLGEPKGFGGKLVGRLLNRGNRSLIAAAVDAADVSTASEVADVGFGGGVGIDLLMNKVDAGGVVHGVEMSATMLSEAHRRFSTEIGSGRLQLHNARLESLPFAAGTLDAIISTNTIYFVDDLAAATHEFKRVLRPTGRLLLGIGDPAAMAKMPFTRHGFRLRPIDEIVATLRAAGFEQIEDRRVGAGPRAFHLLICTTRD